MLWGLRGKREGGGREERREEGRSFIITIFVKEYLHQSEL